MNTATFPSMPCRRESYDNTMLGNEAEAEAARWAFLRCWDEDVRAVALQTPGDLEHWASS